MKRLLQETEQRAGPALYMCLLETRQAEKKQQVTPRNISSLSLRLSDVHGCTVTDPLNQ